MDRYVRQPDPAYAWTDTGVRYNGTGLLTNVTWTGYALNVTSQTWLTPADTDRFTWWHILVVIIPSNFNPTSQPATADLGSMYMTGRCNKPGGAHGGSLPANGNDEDLLVSAYLATHTATIAATLFQIPACPITFAADPLQKARTEDAIIAFTWQHFVSGVIPDCHWLLTKRLRSSGPQHHACMLPPLLPGYSHRPELF